MAKQNGHGRLIAAAAKAALAPLGCKRVGQSRLWISDERHWLIFIEFQPSAWSKGSYLNVNPVWLWLRHSSGDFFDRPHDFIAFESVEQFKPLIEHMAAVAAQSVLAMRSKFQSLAEINRFLCERVSQNGFSIYRAAVTAGLVNDIATARQLFKRMETWDTEGHESWMKVKSECSALAALLDDSVRYRSAMLDTIAERRQRLRLPEDRQWRASMDSTAAE